MITKKWLLHHPDFDLEIVAKKASEENKILNQVPFTTYFVCANCGNTTINEEPKLDCPKCHCLTFKVFNKYD